MIHNPVETLFSVLYFQALFRLSLSGKVGDSPGYQSMSNRADTVLIDADGLSNVLENKTWTKLYPAGLLTVEHRIYQAIPSNVSLIMDDSDIAYMTKENDEPSGLSIGGEQPCNDGLGWRINVNYYGESNPQLVLHHVHRYYRHCVTSCPIRDEYYMVVSLPDDFLGAVRQKNIADGLGSLFGTKIESMEVLTAYHLDYIEGRDYLLPSQTTETTANKL